MSALDDFLRRAVDDCVNARYYPARTRFVCRHCGTPTEAWAGDDPHECVDCRRDSEQNDGMGRTNE